MLTNKEDGQQRRRGMPHLLPHPTRRTCQQIEREPQTPKAGKSLAQSALKRNASAVWNSLIVHDVLDSTYLAFIHQGLVRKPQFRKLTQPNCLLIWDFHKHRQILQI